MTRRSCFAGCGNYGPPVLSRRDMLSRAGMGFGWLALGSLLAAERAAGAGQSSAPIPPPHFRPRAKSVVFLFIGGGPSQVDTFDPKPLLSELNGKDVPPSIAKDVPRIARAPLNNLLASPYKFARHGASGIEISELFPELARHADRLCVLRSMRHDSPIHAPAEYLSLTGTLIGNRPSMGAWVTYGLGSENENLPAFVAMFSNGDSTREPGWAAGFLPSRFQGTRVDGGIDHLAMPAGVDEASRTRQLRLIENLNRIHLERQGNNSELEARIRSYELAYRMQAAAPAAFDLSQETAETRRLYGLDEKDTTEFGTHCLLARRLVERGVRFVQLRHGRWDAHNKLTENHGQNARYTDRPIAALLADLARRGLLDETLIVWGGEFGRTPAAQGNGKDAGRDHSPSGYSMWLAGGGVRGGQIIGATDPVGYAAIERPIHPQNLHATMLHALGIDQYQLTYEHHNRKEIATVNGADVIGEVFA
jgi:hypothetical protein